jgi:hypothetical protein
LTIKTVAPLVPRSGFRQQVKPGVLPDASRPGERGS